MDFLIFKLPKAFSVHTHTLTETMLYARFVAIGKSNKSFIFTDTMAKEQLNISKSSLNRALAKLEKEKLISVKKHYNGKTNLRSINVVFNDEFGSQNLGEESFSTSQNETVDSIKMGTSQNEPTSQIEKATSQIEKATSQNGNIFPFTLLKEVIDKKVIDINVREENKTEKAQGKKLKSQKQISPTREDVVTTFRDHIEKNKSKYPELDFLDVDEQTNLFWLYWNDERHWVDSRGKPVKSLELRVATWVSNWRKSCNKTSVRRRVLPQMQPVSQLDYQHLQSEFESGNIFGTDDEKNEIEVDCEVQDF